MVPVTLLLLIIYAVLIFYYYYHWRQLTTFQPGTIADYPFISVVVAARNEEDHIAALLTALLQQTYPSQKVEIIIADDYSTDATAAIVKSFPQHHIRLLQPYAAKETSSKKKAIETGVRLAKGELIIITDADCIPSPQWLETMVHFYQQKEIVFIAAPVKFTHNNTLLQLFQAMDFMVLQGITAASVSAGFHSMCNGANLAYTKKAFLAVNGFEGIDKISSGDDMLLMYKIEKQYPQGAHYLKNKNAIVTTAPMESWKEFIMQRRRWASKTLYYDDYRVMAVLAFVYAFNIWFLVLLAAAFFNIYNGWWLLIYIAVKTIIEFPFVYSVAQFYNEKKMMRFFPFFQPLHILYTVSVGLLSQLGKYEWKGRNTK